MARTGWFRESRRHSLASHGIKTGTKGTEPINFLAETNYVPKSTTPHTTPEPHLTFDFERYEYNIDNLDKSGGYDWNSKDILGNKILQENIQDAPVRIQRDNGEVQWGLFKGAGYDKSKKQYYIAWSRQEKPSGGLTGETEGKMFLNSKYDTSIKIIKVRGKRLK